MVGITVLLIEFIIGFIVLSIVCIFMLAKIINKNKEIDTLEKQIEDLRKEDSDELE